MAKAAESFVCQSCGATYRKWQGRCDACNGWNTIAEEAPKLAVPKGLSAGRGKAIGFASLSAQPDNVRSEEHTSELQSLMRNSYAVFCLKKKKKTETAASTRTINKRNKKR